MMIQCHMLNEPITFLLSVVRGQKWLRLFEQFSPIYKWTPGGLAKGQSCPRRRASLATNAKPRWGALLGCTRFVDLLQTPDQFMKTLMLHIPFFLPTQEPIYIPFRQLCTRDGITVWKQFVCLLQPKAGIVEVVTAAPSSRCLILRIVDGIV